MMKKLLLIGLVAGGLSFAAVPRSDAQVYFSIGFGPGYYGYTPTGTIIRTAINGRTMATTGLTIRTAGTVTTVTIIIIGTKRA
jgi:hypothetical protein